MDLGPHAAIIWSSYAITVVVLGGLFAHVVLGERRQRAALARLEAQGIHRRSDVRRDDGTDSL